jgi:hypothetical protein
MNYADERLVLVFIAIQNCVKSENKCNKSNYGSNVNYSTQN